mmetsp:Transcript_6742/g.7689  ORF Transcript_6742/g.7689 Transcript_6742/m.7689 type:complete len:216 (+) Transcript_6742:226-873(+)
MHLNILRELLCCSGTMMMMAVMMVTRSESLFAMYIFVILRRYRKRVFYRVERANSMHRMASRLHSAYPSTLHTIPLLLSKRKKSHRRHKIPPCNTPPTNKFDYLPLHNVYVRCERECRFYQNFVSTTVGSDRRRSRRQYRTYRFLRRRTTTYSVRRRCGNEHIRIDSEEKFVPKLIDSYLFFLRVLYRNPQNSKDRGNHRPILIRDVLLFFHVCL